MTEPTTTAMTEDTLKVTLLQAYRCMGLEECEIRPGLVTIIEGGNGVGKTSIAEAIKTGLGGGEVATMVRDPKKPGKIVIALSDGVLASRTVSASNPQPVLKDAAGRQLPAPQTYLKSLLPEFGLNPVEFLDLSDKEMIDTLLKISPVQITVDELTTATGLECTAKDAAGNAFDAIERLYRDFELKRRDANRDAKKQRAAVDGLKGSLSPAANTDLDARHKATVDALAALDGEAAAYAAQAEKAAGEKVLEISQQVSAEVERFQGEIAFLKQQIAVIEQHISAALIAGETARKEAKQKAELAAATFRQKQAAAREALVSELAAVEAAIKQKDRDDNTRQIIASMESEAEAFEAQASDYDGAMKGLLKLKQDKMGTLPFKGIEFVDGKLHWNGVAWHRVNESERWRFAIRLAAMSAENARLKLVVLDGCEKFDATRFKAFAEQAVAIAKERGIQFILTRVTDGPMEVRAME